MAIVIIPGRHLLMTQFQEKYISSILGRPIRDLECFGEFPGDQNEKIDTIIFAVTSANQENSRYNPVPFYARAMNIDRFIAPYRKAEGLLCHIVPIPHQHPSPRFASFTLKEIAEQLGERVDISPTKALILGSTPEVVSAYRELGYAILPAEYDFSRNVYRATTPIDCVRLLAEGTKDWRKNASLEGAVSGSSWSLWSDYPHIPEKIIWIWSDPLLTESGSLTETRSYSVYAEGMNQRVLLEEKYRDIKDAIVPGKIVDEGCADGALITLLAKDFPDSDIIGVELTSEFTARCMERMRAGEFGGTFVHFHQRDLLEPIFRDRSVDTTICNSTTHEIWSYGEKAASLERYLAYKHAQLREGGRLVIRDVVGPEDKDEEVYLWANDADGSNDEPLKSINDREAFRIHLEGLSTHGRFVRFAEDYLADMRRAGRRGEETKVVYREEEVDGLRYFVLRLKDAAEFISKKDYTDNWQSELNEEFAFRSFSEWKSLLGRIGFDVIENPNKKSVSSRAFTIDWIVKHRFEGKVRLYKKEGGALREVGYPVTNMVLIGEKRK